MNLLNGNEMKPMDPGDLGYLAGIFDGEGWIVTNRKTAVSLNIAMTDFDVIYKLHDQTGIGSIEGPFTTKKGKKLQLKWVVRKQEELTQLLHLIMPFLCERRNVRAHEALEILNEQKIERERRGREFVCGHLKSEENTYHFPDSGPNKDKTACRECSRARSRSKNKRK